MDIGTALLLVLPFAVVVLLMGIVWTLHRTTLLPSDIPSRVDPILGKRDRVAIHDTYGPYISMPKDLRTKDEMVAWMTRELPKLTGGAMKSHTKSLKV